MVAPRFACSSEISWTCLLCPPEYSGTDGADEAERAGALPPLAVPDLRVLQEAGDVAGCFREETVEAGLAGARTAGALVLRTNVLAFMSISWLSHRDTRGSDTIDALVLQHIKSFVAWPTNGYRSTETGDTEIIFATRSGAYLTFFAAR